MVEYRPFPEDRKAEFHEMANYAFSPEDGQFDPEDVDERPSLEQPRGLFADDEPLVICAHRDFQLRIRGTDRDVAGLSVVASAPEHRRQGYTKRLLAESLAEYRENGTAFSVLWPFEYSFYRKYGWGTVSQFVYVKTPPEQLGFVTDADATRDAPGTFVELDADDFEATAPVLDAMAERYDFTLNWTQDWWERLILQTWNDDPFVYGWKRDDELRGLLRYTFQESGDDRVLEVNNVAFADETAWLNLLRFCRNHDSQVSEVRIRAPPDVELLDRVDDPRAVTCEQRTGPMFRLVDVADALEQLSPSVAGDDEGRVDVVVSDPLADWNDGRFSVQVRNGSVTAERVGLNGESAEAAEAVPTVHVGIGTLSQLYAGYHDVDEAERIGDLQITRGSSDAARSTLGELFPPRRTHLREGF
ncbi:MAG: enhanced intracellular survival protein Eis [Halopenitus sp.]